jgi:hypothetical protein
MASDTQIAIRWEGFAPGDPDADRTVELLVHEGGEASIEAPSEPGIVFIPIIIGAIALIGLAKAIKGFLTELHCGVMIDTRETPVRITKEKLLPRGLVVSIDKDGKVSIDMPAHESIEDLIKGVVAGK